MAKITQSVDLAGHGRVAVLTVDNPPVNALSQHVRKGLHDGIKQATADGAVQAIVIVCAGRTFIAGADITEFGKPPVEPSLHSVLDLIEGSPKPVVAAIHGTALGGGLEVTLACHYRVGVKAARFGLPEVKLGILPGAGGTQRLPRVVGVEKGLQMMVSGDPIGADEALSVELIDEIATGDLTAAGVAFAEKVVNEKRPLRKIRDLDDKLAAARGKPEVFASFRKSIARQTRGFRAPENIVKAVEAAVSLPFDQGIKRERELFVELLNSAESKAQRYFFFAEREAAKIPDVPADTPAKEIKKAAVIGAGTMGGGIAMNFANAGIPVAVVEVAQEALDRGLGVVRKNYEATAARGRLTAADVEKRMGLIQGTTDWNALRDADIVVEAVFEEMPIKKEVFAKLDGLAKPDAVLATNTSTLDVDEIASATKRPESVIGTHFFSPANVMRLLEVVRGAKSSKTVIATAMAVGHGMQDAAKTMGIVVLALYTGGIQDSTTEIPEWVYYTSATVLAVGTYAGGWRVIRTLGRRIIHLGPPEGFAAETVASSVLYYNALVLGAPISTTHTITSAIMGVGATKKLSAVRWGVAGNILLAWILTFPGAAAIAVVAYILVRPLF